MGLGPELWAVTGGATSCNSALNRFVSTVSVVNVAFNCADESNACATLYEVL